jgi:ribosomal protein S18 acetylase RimI-like enzyme
MKSANLSLLKPQLSPVRLDRGSEGAEWRGLHSLRSIDPNGFWKKSNIYLFIFCLTITSSLMAMEKDSKQMSVIDLERKLCILHDQPNSIPYKPEISDSIHFFFAENERTRVTYFHPISEKQCDDLIENACSKSQKIWWYVTPNTKQFNLEEKLKQKGLAPYPLSAMICSLTEIKLEQQIPDDALTIKAETSSPHMIHYKLLDNAAQVSKGSLFFHEDWVAIHSVETESAQRKKGFAKRLWRHLLEEARKREAKHAILESDPQTYTIYQKIGFKEIFSNIIYHRE